MFNIFLQILDEGHLTDSQGRTVSFKNCIIIMTSNIGSDIILQAKEINDDVKKSIEKMLHKTFRPEFLNRIDAIVYFNRLNEKAIKGIAHIQLQELTRRLQERNITLNISDAAIEHIAELGYSPEFGARPLKRAIQQHVTIPVSQFLLKNSETKQIKVDFKHDTFVIE